ncbi:MAG: glycoside hydrolase family 16 protein, partial [Acutalibacteraceae bacterium]|nr:glycoside hydrolase family 16 protein [Acutalibacteraceae bacterium]
MKKRILSIILAFAMICSCAAIGTFGAAAESETQSFFDRFREDATLVFDDEFDGDKIDTTKWEIASGWGRVEETWGTVDDGNYAVEDGHLTLRAYEKVTHEVTNGKSKYKEIQSGEVSSKAAWGDGLIEVRAKLPKGKGVYPAIWTMGRDFDSNTCKWPWSGEIDIMEAVGKGNENKYNTSTWQTLHTARPNTNNISAGAAHVATGVGQYGTNGGAALNDDYHTFWVYFDKEIMIIGVDDSMMTIKDLS